MAVYRQLQTSFWQDEFVTELTTEERYFYIYIMTNSRTTQCGIYRFNIKMAEYETGCNRETIERLLARFADYGRLLLSKSTTEIMIVNWVKYNFINSRNTLLCMNKELKEVKDKLLLMELYSVCREKGYPVHIIFNGIDLPISAEKKGSLQEFLGGLEGAYRGLGEEEIRIKEEAEELRKKEAITVRAGEAVNIRDVSAAKEEVNIRDISSTKGTEASTEEEKPENIGQVVSAFNNNIHLMTPMEFERILDWLKEVEPGVVVMAIEEAVNNNARNMSYINTVLSNWKGLGITAEKAARAYVRDRRARREVAAGGKGRGSFLKDEVSRKNGERHCGTKVNNNLSGGPLGCDGDRVIRTNAAAYRILGGEAGE